MTQLITIDPNNIDAQKIAKAATTLQNGGTVAFPTETVYGLGANALDQHAVQKIFTAKNRPADNPLIVHIANQQQLLDIVEHIPPLAQQLIDAFWPGPLALIFKRKPHLPNITTGNLSTVAVRIPNNPVALALLEQANIPVAAPSANVSGSPSPTTAQHVINDLDGKIDVIVDGGHTAVGIESTVVDITQTPPMILRPGSITKEQVQQVVGDVQLHPSLHTHTAVDTAPSPGMKYKHYAPNAQVILVPIENMQHSIDAQRAQGKLVGAIHYQKQIHADHTVTVGTTLDEYAHHLFDALRQLDKNHVDVIIAPIVEEQGLGQAIMNRLKKATE